MVQEFITSNGKVIKERDVLFIRNLKLSFSNTILYQVGFPFIALIGFILQFIRATDIEFVYYSRIVFWGIILSSQIPALYDILTKRSFAKRIAINRINSFEIKPDGIGLETFVILHLKSGRYKKIIFRTLEKQYEPFIQLVSQYITPTQLA
ncbi:MAG TPA: hypothetical protein VNA26_05145 [Chitinophagaceae bacterium]|nr:hypothetical protein [Chitinophagaceae bacterium]